MPKRTKRARRKLNSAEKALWTAAYVNAITRIHENIGNVHWEPAVAQAGEIADSAVLEFRKRDRGL